LNQPHLNTLLSKRSIRMLTAFHTDCPFAREYCE